LDFGRHSGMELVFVEYINERLVRNPILPFLPILGLN